MANTNAGFGFKVLGNASGGAYTGSIREYPLASASSTAIYLGDIVKLLGTGYVDKKTADGVTTVPLGIVVGFRWTATDGTIKYGPYWPGSTATLNSADAAVQVADDPALLLLAQFDNSTLTAAQELALRGALFEFTTNTGNASSGQSATVVASGTTGATGYPLRYIGPSTDPTNDLTGGYIRGLFRFSSHAYQAAVPGI